LVALLNKKRAVYSSFFCCLYFVESNITAMQYQDENYLRIKVQFLCTTYVYTSTTRNKTGWECVSRHTINDLYQYPSHSLPYSLTHSFVPTDAATPFARRAAVAAVFTLLLAMIIHGAAVPRTGPGGVVLRAHVPLTALQLIRQCTTKKSAVKIDLENIVQSMHTR
jgi:hypothetical protein